MRHTSETGAHVYTVGREYKKKKDDIPFHRLGPRTSSFRFDRTIRKGSPGRYSISGERTARTEYSLAQATFPNPKNHSTYFFAFLHTLEPLRGQLVSLTLRHQGSPCLLSALSRIACALASNHRARVAGRKARSRFGLGRY